MPYKDKQKQKKYDKQYRGKNKDKLKKYAKLYREKHKEKIKEDNKRYCKNNKDKLNKYKKEWYKKNKDRILKARRGYYKNNIDKIKANVRNYRKKNLDKIKEYEKKRYYQKACPDCGKLIGYNRNYCINCRSKMERNNQWKNGISFEPYGLDFNCVFRKSIRERDNYQCIICNKSEEELNKKLSVHHIDYNKLNSFKENCISLCVSRHTMTNRNRESWKAYFRKLLFERYSYTYEQEQTALSNFSKVIGENLAY